MYADYAIVQYKDYYIQTNLWKLGKGSRILKFPEPLSFEVLLRCRLPWNMVEMSIVHISCWKVHTVHCTVSQTWIGKKVWFDESNFQKLEKVVTGFLPSIWCLVQPEVWISPWGLFRHSPVTLLCAVPTGEIGRVWKTSLTFLAHFCWFEDLFIYNILFFIARKSKVYRIIIFSDSVPALFEGVK